MNNNTLDHLAIIMDGNGRWALDKGLDRTADMLLVNIPYQKQ